MLCQHDDWVFPLHPKVWQKFRMLIFVMVWWISWAYYYILVYTHRQELWLSQWQPITTSHNECDGLTRHGQLSWSYYQSLSYYLQNVGVEISLQSHGYSFCRCLFPFLQLVKHISLYAHMCLLSETVSGVSFRYLISHCSSFDSHKQISNLSPYHSLLLYQSSPLQLLVAEVKNLCSYWDHIVTERSK